MTNDSEIYVAAFARTVDGERSRRGGSNVDSELERLRLAGARMQTLVIDPLRAGWDTAKHPDHFRSGAAAAFAVEEACRRLRAGQADAIQIEGRDLLRTGYSRSERHDLMRIYQESSVPEGYNQLAEAYAEQRGWDRATFFRLRDALFENHVRRGKELGLPMPPAHRFALLTPWFRFVDCANPVVDFDGQLVLATREFAADPRLAVRGVGVGAVAQSGLEALPEIVTFAHLRAAGLQAMTGFGIDEFIARFRSGRALLQLYACFPIIPIAALMELGFADGEEDLLDLLQTHPVTVNAGMNLGRGAWANAALDGCIAMCEAMDDGDVPIGLVHANGGLGHRQGFVLFARLDP